MWWLIWGAAAEPSLEDESEAEPALRRAGRCRGQRPCRPDAVGAMVLMGQGAWPEAGVAGPRRGGDCRTGLCEVQRFLPGLSVAVRWWKT